MAESALDLVTQAITSPWVYAVIVLLTALDGFFPVIPGETALITVAVFATTGESNLLFTMAAGIAGAFIGDHTAYLIGRQSIGRLTSRMRAGTKGRAAFDWASRELDERGGMALVASRFVPGVRTATTVTMGTVHYPLRLFSLFDCLASSCWAVGWSLVGYVGGATFKDSPVKGVLLGLALAMSITMLTELVRYLRRRSRHSADSSPPASTTPPDHTPR